MKLGRSWGRLGMKYKTYTLSELVQIKYGKSQKKVLSDKGIVPIYGTGGLMGYATESLYDKPSVLIGRKGTIGRVRYVDHPFWTIDTMFYTVINNELVIPKYLFYLMSQIDLNIYNEGTTIPSLRTETLNRLEFNIPSLNDQKKVLSFLMPIDDKIHLNTKINKNLEQQAQTFFGHFYKSISGQMCALSEIIEIKDGTHDSPKAVNNGYPLVTSKHLLPFGVDTSSANTISKNDYDKINERSKVNTGDILISMIGTVGLISYVIDSPVEFAIKNVGLFKTSQHPSLDSYILCYLKSISTTHHIERCLAGSTQKYISLGELRKLPIILPSQQELDSYNSVVRPIISEIALLVQENQRLSNIRDSLLPKLISGELDVSDVYI